MHGVRRSLGKVEMCARTTSTAWEALTSIGNCTHTVKRQQRADMRVCRRIHTLLHRAQRSLETNTVADHGYKSGLEDENGGSRSGSE